MDVESALGRKINDVLRQDVSVSDDDADVRLEALQLLQQLRVARILRLEDRNLFLLRDLLDHRGNHLARTPLRLVGLRDNADYVESFTDESAQRRGGQLSGAPRKKP